MAITWNNEAFKQIKILTPPENPAIFGLLVEGGTKIPEVNVIYKDALSASLVGGDTATLPIASKKMKSDIKITVPESAFSNIPTEVSTEAEMTALLTSGEVGGVYKYTGETGTYENGALYVLEEEAESIVGTWVFNDGVADDLDTITPNTFSFNFTSNGNSYTSFVTQYGGEFGMAQIYYDSTLAYGGDMDTSWQNEAYKTINITSEPTDEAFITWLKANATKQ